MAKIRVDLDHPIQNGETITFKAPCDCTSASEGLIVYYPQEDGAGTQTMTFTLKDSHNNTLHGLGNLFSVGALVAVIVNTDARTAHILNADTNGYLEKQANTTKDHSGWITYDQSGSEALAVVSYKKHIKTALIKVEVKPDNNPPSMIGLSKFSLAIDDLSIATDSNRYMVYDFETGGSTTGDLGLFYDDIPVLLSNRHGESVIGWLSPDIARGFLNLHMSTADLMNCNNVLQGYISILCKNRV